MKTLIRQQITPDGIGRPTWKTMGWQGMTMRVPPAWNLVGYGGDFKAGSLRLDNSEFQTHGVLGVDLRWMPVKGSVTEADLEKRLRSYLDSIEKSAKRQKISAVVQVKAITDARHPERLGQRAFSWKADRKAVGRIWHCPECSRIIIAQVLGSTTGDFSSLATDALHSLKCHAEDSNWRTWSLYDLHTSVPSDYTLHGKLQLMNIYVQLPFVRGTSLDTVTVEQWGVANVQLRNAYLDQWFRDKNRALEGQLKYESRETTALGHPALALTGRRWGLSYWMSHAVPQITRLQNRRLILRRVSGNARRPIKSIWSSRSAAVPSRRWSKRSSSGPCVTVTPSRQPGVYKPPARGCPVGRRCHRHLNSVSEGHFPAGGLYTPAGPKRSIMSRLNLLQNLRQSIPFLAREKGGLPRGEMLALRPMRSQGIAWEMKPSDADSPGATLTVPRREDKMGQILSRLFQVPASKTIELDEFGAAVWSKCDGQHSVEQLINFTCSTYKLNRRQGEVSVVTFMRMLAQRRLIGLQKKSAEKTVVGKDSSCPTKRPTPGAKQRPKAAVLEHRSICPGARRFRSP